MGDGESFYIKENNMAKELIDISPHSVGRGLDIPFKNGQVSVPDTPSGYCISSGCGSGKTESIKSLIRYKHSEGILYGVDTIPECQKMYEWCNEELVTPGVISSSDVLMINSKSNIESMKIYQDKPELITHVKILIVVQVRFFVELINYFLLYKPLSHPLPFDGDFGALMRRQDIRRWIIFDETPLFLKPFVLLTKGELAPYAVRSGKEWKCRSPSEVRDIYNTFIKGDKTMDYNCGGKRLDRIKNEVVVGEIPRRFSTWMAQNEKNYTIQYYPSDWVQPGMTSHVLIYEGAGDVLIGQGSRFDLLDIAKKYNANVEFHKFSFTLQRKKEPDDNTYADFVCNILTVLKTVVGKTLIVVWKDFNGGALTNGSNCPNVEKLQEALDASCMDPDTYTITYYGASDTKSTNAYRDYTNIVLAGRWGLGGAVIDKLKKAFDCKSACMENYMMWYYVQLLCRIGIRMGDGHKYHVYYSSDHTNEFIYRLSVYFNQNIFIPQKIKGDTPLWQVLVKQYIKRGQGGYLKDISALINHDSALKDAIERGQPYHYTISLNDLATICPRRKKPRKDNYQRSLGKFLKVLSIDLDITK